MKTLVPTPHSVYEHHIPYPLNEQARLQALNETGLLDTEPEAEYDELAQLAAAICGTNVALIVLISSNRNWIKSAIGAQVCEAPRNEGFCSYTILEKDVLIVPNALLDKRFAGNPWVACEDGIRFYAGVPLITTDGHAIGSLCVVDNAPRSLSTAQIDGLRLLARQISSRIELRRRTRALETAVAVQRRNQLELEQANARLQRLCRTDGLTGLHNRRSFDEQLELELARQERTTAALTLMMLDVDDFKQINDSQGHPVGDRILRQLAALLRDTARATDQVARFGGEEFALLLPNTNGEEAMQLAERIRSGIERSAVVVRSAEQPRAVTVSIGLATAVLRNRPQPQQGVAQWLVEQADTALYQAKHSGKNCIVRAEQDGLYPPIDAVGAEGLFS